MKTVTHLKTMLEANNKRLLLFLDIPKTERKKLIKTNAILLDLKSYLETNPNQDFIFSEKKRVKKIIAAKQAQFYEWRTTVLDETDMSPEKQKRLFCKETGITNLRKQLKNLNFLLNEKQEQPAFR